MLRLKTLLLLSCVSLTHACIEVPPIEDPVGAPQPDPNADFTFTAVPSQEQVLPGGALDCEVQLTWVGARGGDVAMSLVSPPEGIHLQPFTLSAEKTRAKLSISIGAATTPGSYSLTLQGRSGAVTKQATLAVTVGKAGDLVVNWVVPTPGKAYTNGPLLLQFTVGGGSAEAVEILKDASVLAKPSGTPYSFTWDTTQEAEGTYQLSIRAIRGGATFLSTPRTVIVDRTAPTVSSFLPARNAAAVGVRESIQVTFSEPMNPLSVTEEMVRLTTSAGAPIPKAVSLSVDGKTLTVAPLNPLAPPDTVSVDLAPAVGVLTDLAGNSVGSSIEWAFTVPMWLPLGGAISAVIGQTPAEGVVLKMDRNDQPVIAWSESDGTNKNIYVARWTGAAWSMLGAPLSGLSAVGTNAANPSLSFDSANQLVVAWDETTGNGMGRDVFARRWAGDSWTALPTVPLVSSTETLARSPRLAVDSTGTIALHMIEQSTGNARVRGFKLLPGGVSWIDLNPAQPSNHFFVGGVSVAATGANIFAAYSAYDDAVSRRGVSVLRNNAAPQGGVSIGTMALEPCIAVDASTHPWLAWTQSPSSDALSDGMIYWSRWEGSNWSTPALVSPTSTGNTGASLALGAGGPHILAWSGIVESERSILVSRWVSGSWQPLNAPLNALTVSGTPAFGPSVAMDVNAQPLIAWTEADATSASVYVVRLND